MKPDQLNYCLIDIPVYVDARGQIVPIEECSTIPFRIARSYHIVGTPVDLRRGDHAHKTLRQFVIAVAGSCGVCLDDGESKISMTLTRPDQGLLIEPLVWHTMHSFSKECVLLVLADQPYDESDYIRDYNDFLQWIRS